MEEKLLADSPDRLLNQIVDNLDIKKIVDIYKEGGTSRANALKFD